MAGSMVGGREMPEPLLLLASTAPDPLLASMATTRASGLQATGVQGGLGQVCALVCLGNVMALM